MYYRWTGTTLEQTPSEYAPGYTLTEANHAEHTYPVNGWRWFDTLDEARQYYGLPAADGSVISVSPYQARVALIDAGLLDAVNAAVTAADAKTRAAWEYATRVERSSPIIASMAAGLGLTSEQVDDLFKVAAHVQ